MLRTASTAILILAGSALVLCLTLRLVVSAVFALSGIRRRAAHTQVLSW
jgi:hypothetical protein